MLHENCWYHESCMLLTKTKGEGMKKVSDCGRCRHFFSYSIVMLFLSIKYNGCNVHCKSKSHNSLVSSAVKARNHSKMSKVFYGSCRRRKYYSFRLLLPSESFIIAMFINHLFWRSSSRLYCRMFTVNSSLCVLMLREENFQDFDLLGILLVYPGFRHKFFLTSLKLQVLTL